MNKQFGSKIENVTLNAADIKKAILKHKIVTLSHS